MTPVCLKTISIHQKFQNIKKNCSHIQFTKKSTTATKERENISAAIQLLPYIFFIVMALNCFHFWQFWQLQFWQPSVLTIFNLGYFQAKFLNGFQEQEQQQHINCMDLAIKNTFEKQDLFSQS